jgi:hypothetical protein
MPAGKHDGAIRAIARRLRCSVQSGVIGRTIQLVFPFEYSDFRLK